jgi:membrane-bound lytic murein transglycosylase C
MKKIAFFLTATLLFSQTFNQFVSSQNREFNKYKQDLNTQFKLYKKTINEEFEAYKKELLKYWKNPKLPSKTEYVEYSKDLKTQKSVDFDKNEITIKVIDKNPNKALLKIAKALANISVETEKEAVNNNKHLKNINQKLKKIAVTSNPTNTPIIGDVIYKKPPTKKEVIDFVRQSISNYPIQKEKSKIPNTFVYTIKVPLPNKAYIVKAKKFKPLVMKRAKRFELSPALIYAIIHTESSFNPLATSYVPAFGLMQIVPTTAGKDAYKMLYGKPKLLSPSYLYNPKNNILIGSAYLNLLYYHYFKGVNNPISKLYLTIAAYNTGVGNVACVFNSKNYDYKKRVLCYRYRGDYSIKKALPVINSFSPQEIYTFLIEHLRYDEARNYLKRVRKRVYMYHKALKNNLI